MANGHQALFAHGYAGQLIEIVPDLGLVVAVLSRHKDPAEPGTADWEYVSLVSSVIAPRIR
jgi:CubicO group peptidase (beta-lactamase class C family)